MLFFVIGHIGYYALSKIVEKSEYRLATAVLPGELFSGKEVTFIIGDSRMMDGVNALQANNRSTLKTTYNFAFNGLGLPDSIAFLKTFLLKCNCNITKIVINTGSLKNRNKEYSEFQLFASGFNKNLLSSTFSEKPNMYYATYLFPLMHFNNEVFLRSLYFYIKNESDQNHFNSYKFKASDNVIANLKKKDKSIVVDEINIKNLVAFSKERNIKLSVVTTPHHPLYVKNKKNYLDYISAMERLSLKYGYNYFNQSHLFIDNDDFFSDLLHLNKIGQKKYTEHLITSGILN